MTYLVVLRATVAPQLDCTATNMLMSFCALPASAMHMQAVNVICIEHYCKESTLSVLTWGVDRHGNCTDAETRQKGHEEVEGRGIHQQHWFVGLYYPTGEKSQPPLSE